MTDEFDDLDEQLDGAKLPERSVEVCLRSDLVEEYKRLRAELASETEDSLASGGTNEALEGLEQQIRKATKKFVFRALPRTDYRKLVNKHRAQKPEDRGAGLDMDSFMAALVRACVVSPQMTETRWQKLDLKLSTGQWEKIHAAVHVVNSTEANIPF